uniref:Uncharacterized protein n=1 Tax=Homalodisca liturata TaxID=320908 RepID=A0A1B6JX04_9HEMI
MFITSKSSIAKSRQIFLVLLQNVPGHLSIYEVGVLHIQVEEVAKVQEVEEDRTPAEVVCTLAVEVVRTQEEEVVRTQEVEVVRTRVEGMVVDHSTGLGVVEAYIPYSSSHEDDDDDDRDGFPSRNVIR